MPARLRVQPEAVARAPRRADAPARCRGAGFQRLRRPDEKQRPAGVAGGELQLLAQFQLEPVDHCGDRKRDARTQGLGHGPQRVFAVRRLDQDRPSRIETERIETVSAQPAVAPPPLGRHDKDDRMGRAGEKRHDETESGRQRAWRCGHDFMQRAAGKTAIRQAGIEGGKTEGQGAARPGAGGNEPAQFVHQGGAIAPAGKRRGRRKRCGKC